MNANTLHKVIVVTFWWLVVAVVGTIAYADVHGSKGLMRVIIGFFGFTSPIYLFAVYMETK